MLPFSSFQNFILFVSPALAFFKSFRIKFLEKVFFSHPVILYLRIHVFNLQLFGLVSKCLYNGCLIYSLNYYEEDGGNIKIGK